MNFKKFLSLFLILSVIMSFTVFNVNAVFTDTEQIDKTHNEAIDMCIALNIIEGYPDGSFKPNDNISRAEMSKIICVAINGGVLPATATKSTPTFSDIQNNWAEGYIEYCFTKGIVAGIGNNQFNPEGNVTASEAAKMLLVSLGYNATIEGYVGPSWETAVNVQANQDGLYKNLTDITTNAPLTREHAAQMIWNTLQAFIINKSSSIDRTDGSIIDIYSKSLTEDLLYVSYKGEIIEGTLNGFNWNSKDKTWDYTINNTVINSGSDYTSLIGQKVKAIYDMNSNKTIKDAYGIFAVDSKVVFSGIVGNISTLNNSENEIKFNNVKYRLEDTINNTPVYCFENTANQFFTANYLNKLIGKNIITYNSMPVYAVDYDGNNKIDFLMVTPISIAKVTYVNLTKFRTAAATFGTMPAKEWLKDEVNIDSNIVKDDYVVITAAINTSNDTDTFVKLETINGKVTTKSDRDITINNETYTLDESYTTDIKAGSTLKNAAIYNGYIFDADATGNFKVNDYVIALGSESGAFSDSVKLIFADGTKKIVDLDTNYLSANQIRQYGYGQLYTYSINRDGEYQLSLAPSFGTGFNYTHGNGAKDENSLNIKNISKSSSKIGYIDNFKITDDSVIFINYNENSYKVISGATLKTMNYEQFTGSYILATDNRSTGIGEVNMAYLTTNASTIRNNNSQYGYITKIVEAQNSDNDDIYIVSLMTAAGEITLNTTKLDNNLIYNLTDNGIVIEYTLDENGNLDYVEQVINNMIPITGKNENTLWIYDTNNYECVKDVGIVIVDAVEIEAIEVGTINDIGLAEKPETVFLPNAFVVFNDDNEIVFIAYDINNGI